MCDIYSKKYSECRFFLTEFLQDEKQRSGRVPGLTPEGRYERNYLTVFDLMTHTDDMMLDDLFQYSLVSYGKRT